MPQDNAAGAESQPQAPPPCPRRAYAALAAILLLSAIPRFYDLGRDSLWYDEVIPMRLAREPNPAAMIRLLNEIEATRAPLHPLILMGWLRIFGTSEASGRSLNAVCGVFIVAVVFGIGRRLGGTRSALWSAVLAACSPLLIEYSREVKMYSFFTLLVCLAWWELLGFRRSFTIARVAMYPILVAAIVYTHPLGLLMAGTLGLGSLIDLKQSRLSFRSWLGLHVAAALLVLPWISRYFDHPPEYIPGPVGIKFLLGMPIGFTGGNGITLLVFLSIATVGLLPLRRGKWVGPSPDASPWPVVVWLGLPPVGLFVYSLVGNPLFGPARYNMYVAPAYLLLLGRGFATIRPALAIPLGAVMLAIALSCDQALKASRQPRADWREAAALLERYPGVPVIVVAPERDRNLEVVVARYYLGPGRTVSPMPMSDAAMDAMVKQQSGTVFLSCPLTGQGMPEMMPYEYEDNWLRFHWNFRGLTISPVRAGARN